MSPRRQQVPCPTCIEQATVSHTDNHLCASCVAVTKARTPSLFAPSINNDNSNQRNRGSILLLKIHRMAAAADVVDSPAHKTDICNLETWSRTMVSAINARDFTHPVFALAHQDFVAGAIDVFAPTRTPTAHLAMFRKMTEESPEYHMHLDDITTDLEPGGEWAKVYMTIRATGRPPGLTREALGVFTWNRREGGEGWWLVAHESMRTWGMNCEPGVLPVERARS